MHKQIIIPLAVMVLGLTNIACQAPATEAHADAIEAVVDNVIAAINRGDLESIVAANTDDAIWLPPNQPSLSGHEVLRSWFQDFFNEYRVQLSLTSEEVVVADEWAFQRYAFAWTLTPVAGGEPTRDNGKGIHIFRHQPDGSWKYFRNVWNTNTSPAGAD